MGTMSFPKGYLLSSTPVQSSEDSGYFGSGQRRSKSNVNALSSCSPIKESSFKTISEILPFQSEYCKTSPQLKFDKNRHLNSIKNESSVLQINELSELESPSSNFSDKTDLLKTHSSITKQELLDIHYDSNNAENRFVLNSLLLEDKDVKYKLFEFEQSDLNISSGDDNSEYSKCLNESSSVRTYEKKETKTDFIHELKIRNCSSIISSILQYLSSKELSRASCVSKEWNKVILDDYRANLRRKTFLTERFLLLNGPSKENRLGMRCGPANEHKLAFSDLTNNYAAAHLPVRSKVSNTKFDSFLKEAKNGKKLQKCPRCSFASKLLDGNEYMCSHCSYHFCRLCLNPILNKHTCFKPQLPNIVVGSKRSKKNLRRL